jgi:hypothetical protein
MNITQIPSFGGDDIEAELVPLIADIEASFAREFPNPGFKEVLEMVTKIDATPEPKTRGEQLKLRALRTVVGRICNRMQQGPKPHVFDANNLPMTHVPNERCKRLASWIESTLPAGDR